MAHAHRMGLGPEPKNGAQTTYPLNPGAIHFYQTTPPSSLRGIFMLLIC